MAIPVQYHRMIPIRVLAKLLPLNSKQIILRPERIFSCVDFELAVPFAESQQVVSG